MKIRKKYQEINVSLKRQCDAITGLIVTDI